MDSRPIDQLLIEIEKLRRSNITAATERGYRHDWKTFAAWCERVQRTSLPATPETLSLFLMDMLSRGRKVVTARRYAAGVGYYHRCRRIDSPLTEAVRDLLCGAQQIRREQPRQMLPLSLVQLRAIATAMRQSQTPVAVRNLAIVLVGFASALRLSNLTWMRSEDIEWCGDGLRINVRREKQDRTRAGRLIGIPHGKHAETCAVRALRAWMDLRGDKRGPLFTRLDVTRKTPLDPLSHQAIYGIIKSAIALVEGSASQMGPHSLRSGFISEAGCAGISHLVIARHSGHSSLDSLQRYFRPADVFRTNAAGMLDL